MQQPGSAGWFWRSSFGRAWQDTFALHLLRTLMTMATAVVAALIVFTATGNPAAWWVVLASPIVLLLTSVVLLIANLLGWNRLWTGAWSMESGTDGHGPRLCLFLRPKNWTRAYGNNPSVDTSVRQPDGRLSKHAVTSRAIQGQWWALYPDDFEDPQPLISGTYQVIWSEEIRPGKWREVITYRIPVVLAGLNTPDAGSGIS